MGEVVYLALRQPLDAIDGVWPTLMAAALEDRQKEKYASSFGGGGIHQEQASEFENAAECLQLRFDLSTQELNLFLNACENRMR